MHMIELNDETLDLVSGGGKRYSYYGDLTGDDRRMLQKGKCPRCGGRVAAYQNPKSYECRSKCRAFFVY